LEASTVCWRESARHVQLSGNQAAEDRVCRVAMEDRMMMMMMMMMMMIMMMMMMMCSVRWTSQKGTYQLMGFRMKLPFSVKVCTG